MTKPLQSPKSITDWTTIEPPFADHIICDRRILTLIHTRNLMCTISARHPSDLDSLWEMRTTLLTYDLIAAVAHTKADLLDFAQHMGIPIIPHASSDISLSPDFMIAGSAPDEEFSQSEEQSDLPGEIDDDSPTGLDMPDLDPEFFDD
jgi:hypothetical protein